MARQGVVLATGTGVVRPPSGRSVEDLSSMSGEVQKPCEAKLVSRGIRDTEQRVRHMCLAHT